MGGLDLDDWDSQEIIYSAFGIFGGLIIFLSIFCACCNRRRQRKSVISNQSNHSNHSSHSNNQSDEDSSSDSDEAEGDGFILWIFIKIILFCTPFVIWYCCVRMCQKKRSPVVVTTATTQVPFTPGQPMQHTIIQSNQPYPMGHQGFGMPMPPPNQHSYPMPQPGYPPYPSGGAPYPPAGPHENMNPPSYDQVVGTTNTTITNENYAKQAPYNPNYMG